MEGAFLALSTAYHTRKRAEKTVQEARLNAQVNVHVACVDIQKRDEAFARERYDMESHIRDMEAQIRDISRSIEALDLVHTSSANESWKTVDNIRRESHTAIHAACVELQQTETLVENAHDMFDKAFAEEKVRVDNALATSNEGVIHAEARLVAAQDALTAANAAYMDAKTKYDESKVALVSAHTVRTALDALAKEADSFADSFVEPAYNGTVEH